MKKLVCLVAVCLAVSCSDDDDSSNNTSSNNANNTSSNNANNTSSNNANNTSSNNANNTSSNNASNNGSNNAGNNNTNNGNNSTNNGNCTLLDPAIGTCDPICQSGCSTGENCVAKQPSATEAPTAACLAAGAKTSGECTADTECAKGHVCLAVDAGATQCVPYCSPGANSGCAAGATCRPFSLELRLGVCVVETDECEFFPDTCGDGKNCYDTPQGTRCASYDDTATAGKTCTTSNECNDGFRCVGVNGGGLSCQRICNPDEPACSAETSCQRMADADGNPLAWGACL